MRRSGKIIKSGSNLNEMYENQVALANKEKYDNCLCEYQMCTVVTHMDSPAQNTTVNFRNNVGFIYLFIYFATAFYILKCIFLNINLISTVSTFKVSKHCVNYL